MTRWERHWFGPVDAVRPYVLERAVLFLLVLDVWTQWVPHGAPVRFQYYLYLVADLQRRGEPAQVLAGYEKAETYAPAGQSRRRQIEALRSRLASARSE